jgi:hypothetical protein
LEEIFEAVVMQVIALAGRNSQTHSWLDSLLSAVPLPTDGLVRYRHWSSDVEPSVDFEATLLTGLTPDLVVAKSFGTSVASTAFCSQQFRPRAAVFVGTPYAALSPDETSKLREFAREVETLFIQQAADPGGSAVVLPTALKLIRGEVAEVPGSDHLYQDIALLAKRIRAWKHASSSSGAAA